MSGTAVRPIALRDVSAIAKEMPDFPILATGGIDSGDAALQFLYAGASVFQICSAVHNQEFTVVQDYITALKCLLYLSAKENSNWDGQSPPVSKQLIETIKEGQKLPRFGEFKKQRTKIREEYAKTRDVLTVEHAKEPALLPKEPVKEVPSVNQLKGKALDKIGKWNELDIQQQAVAIVDEDLCVNCGKCYMTCNDSGYQAILFDAETHIPVVTDDCTGCALCVSVCPIPDCLTMVPRKTHYAPQRGHALPEDYFIKAH